MRLARCLASWLVHTSTSKGRGRGQGLTPYPPTLRVARHQAAYPLPPYPKCPDAYRCYPTLPPGCPEPCSILFSLRYLASEIVHTAVFTIFNYFVLRLGELMDGTGPCEFKAYDAIFVLRIPRAPLGR